MANDTTPRILDRRSFLRGSALFAAAIGLSVAPGAAPGQPQAGPAEAEAGRERRRKRRSPTDPFGDGEKPKDGQADRQGRPRVPRLPAVRATTCTSRAACGCARTAATSYVE